MSHFGCNFLTVLTNFKRVVKDTTFQNYYFEEKNICKFSKNKFSMHVCLQNLDLLMYVCRQHYGSLSQCSKNGKKVDQ